MTAKNDLIQNLTIAADTEDEAVLLLIETLKGLADARDARGFTLPALTSQTIEKIDEEWKHVYVFSSEFLPAAVA